jgi:hypothetical protein
MEKVKVKLTPAEAEALLALLSRTEGIKAGDNLRDPANFIGLNGLDLAALKRGQKTLETAYVEATVPPTV